MRFIDTNVLLYTISTHEAESSKADIARGVLETRDLTLSSQVLGEFYVQATRASKPDALTHDQAVRLVESFTRFRVQAVTVDIVTAALESRKLFGLSYWDALIVETARSAGCGELVTEDLQDGQNLTGVMVRNPFG